MYGAIARMMSNVKFMPATEQANSIGTQNMSAVVRCYDTMLCEYYAMINHASIDISLDDKQPTVIEMLGTYVSNMLATWEIHYIKIWLG